MKKVLLSVCLVCSLGALVPLETSLRKARPSTVENSSDTAWVRYVMVGLGGFRGLISEALWIRADRLQQQGRYFELAQLADWITALDPKATKSWVFNSWNLAYNISAMLPDYDARTHWVFRGIDLLENKAIPVNPTAASLYYELGFNYQFKIGGEADPASEKYKLALANMYQPPANPPVIPSDVSPEGIALLAELDYRIPASHAIYWAELGLRYAKDGFEKESLRRMIHQNLVTIMIGNGIFTGDLSTGRYKAEPLPRLFPYYIAISRKTLSLYPEESQVYAISYCLISRKMHAIGEEDFSRKAYDEYCRISVLAGRKPLTYEDILNDVAIPE